MGPRPDNLTARAARWSAAHRRKAVLVLFGLSMDYHVLILSRVREAYDAGMSAERAVDYGIGPRQVWSRARRS